MSLVVNAQSQVHLESLIGTWNTVVVCFTAPAWCVPCQRFEPHFERAAELMPEAVFVSVNADDHEDIVADYGVLGVPMVMLYKNQHFVKTLLGRTVNQLSKEIKGE